MTDKFMNCSMFLQIKCLIIFFREKLWLLPLPAMENESVRPLVDNKRIPVTSSYENDDDTNSRALISSH